MVVSQERFAGEVMYRWLLLEYRQFQLQNKIPLSGRVDFRFESNRVGHSIGSVQKPP